MAFSNDSLWDDRSAKAIRDSVHNHDTFQWTAYCAEMRERLVYFRGNQVVQNPNPLVNHTAAGSELVDVWNSSLSGPGWDDIRVALNETSRNAPIHPEAVPFLQKVIRNIAVVYSKPVRSRTLTTGGDPDKDASKLLAEVYAAGKRGLLDNHFCQWVHLFDTAFMYFGWDAARQTVRPRVLAPWQVFVEPDVDDPSDLQSLDCKVRILMEDPPQHIEELDGTLTWQVWQGDEFWYERGDRGDARFEDRDCTIQGSMANPYRDKDGRPVKPILVQHSAPSDDIYYVGDHLKVIANKAIDRMMTGLGSTLKWSSFAVPVFQGLDQDEINGAVLSPMTPLALSQPDSNFKFERPASPLGETMQVIVRKARMYARLHDMDPEEVDPESKVMSGSARMMSRVSLQERRDNLVPLWMPYERESAWLTCVVWNAHRPQGDGNPSALPALPAIRRFKRPGDPEGYELETTFGDMSVAADPLADAMAVKMRCEMGLQTPADQIATERGVSIDSAKDIHKANVEYNEATAPSVTFADIARGRSNADKPGRIGGPGNPPLKPDEPGRGDNVAVGSGNAATPNA